MAVPLRRPIRLLGPPRFDISTPEGTDREDNKNDLDDQDEAVIVVQDRKRQENNRSRRYCQQSQ